MKHNRLLDDSAGENSIGPSRRRQKEQAIFRPSRCRLKICRHALLTCRLLGGDEGHLPELSPVLPAPPTTPPRSLPGAIRRSAALSPLLSRADWRSAVAHSQSVTLARVLPPQSQRIIGTISQTAFVQLDYPVRITEALRLTWRASRRNSPWDSWSYHSRISWALALRVNRRSCLGDRTFYHNRTFEGRN